MIKTADEMARALRRQGKAKPRFAGLILYRGKSALDGAPIVVIATGMARRSGNTKTGAMVQTFVIRADVHPVIALQTGADESVCGSCMHRPIKKGACYVNVGKSVASIYRALQRGRYAEPGIDYDSRILAALFAGRVVRLGSYGDPAAAPFQMWRAITLRARAHTGYSHQWRNPRFQAFKLLCMASADSAADELEAAALGWRAFRVRRADEPRLAYEANCGASAEMGFKVTCADCRACGGTSAKARAHITIINHGFRQSRFAAAQSALAA